eukprot:5738100-Prymnesium_polylepis.1
MGGECTIVAGFLVHTAGCAEGRAGRAARACAPQEHGPLARADASLAAGGSPRNPSASGR